MSTDKPVQMLECFGVGLGATLLLVLLIGLLVWLLVRAEKYEVRLALWFSRHPRLLKVCKVAGVAILAFFVVACITALGCSILGVL